MWVAQFVVVLVVRIVGTVVGYDWLWVLNCCFLYVNRLIVVYTVVCLCIVVVYYAVYCFWFEVRWCFPLCCYGGYACYG